MQIVILILVLILASYIIGERAFRIQRFSLGSMIFLAYGAEFAILGFLLGPYALDILSADVIDQLEPLINIALGWIGLMFGAQFRIRDLKLLPLSNYVIASTEAIATFVIVFACFIALGMLFPSPFPTANNVVRLAAVLAAIATVSSSAAIAATIKRVRAHGRVSRLLSYTAGFDNLAGLIAFGLAYPFFHFTAQGGEIIIPGWGWLLLSLGSGLMLGVLFHFFTTPRASSNENLMIAVGMVTLSTGLASYLHLSALFINLIVGMVLCNFSERQDRFYRLLIAAEKPLYGIMLIIAGALWKPSWNLAIIVAVFIVVRTAAKMLGGWIAIKPYSAIVRYPEWFGPALIAQGGMAMAIALDYRFLAPGETSTLFVAVILTALAINSFISPFTAKRMLIMEGETT